eukprot:g29753.t1
MELLPYPTEKPHCTLTPEPHQVSFDPIAEKSADPYSNLETMEQKKKSDDNLIHFGSLDEFDPVAHQFDTPGQKERHWARAGWGVVTGPRGGRFVCLAPMAAAEAASAEAGDFNPNSGTQATGDGGDLLGLGGAASSSVEEPDKKMIFVYHKGEKNCVGWYSDMKPEDIKEAILCACDAIMDGGFVLREVQLGDDEEKAEPREETGPMERRRCWATCWALLFDGQVFEFEHFHQLQNGQTYAIEAAGEREDLKKITGDRFRRLKVQIDPKLHVEAVKAIDRMRRVQRKHTHYGFPHLRQFQLSDDTKRLIWYSGAKRKEDSMVNLDEVVEIKLGQQTPVFLHYRLPMLEHLSFSIIYGPKGSKTLDLTCKDEFEFDHWVTGLKAIFYSSKNKQISKEALLAHSKRFQKAMEKNNVGIKLTKLPEVKEKGHVGLDDCIEIVTHTPQQLDTKMERLRERLKTMSQQVSRLDHHSAAEMEVDLSLLTGQGPAYASVFVQDEDAQDEEMEIRRMHELVEQTTQVLQQARNELIALNQRQRSESSASNTEAKAKKKETAACKHIDQLLWKAEVDLENVEDMYLRHIDNQKETYSLGANSVDLLASAPFAGRRGCTKFAMPISVSFKVSGSGGTSFNLDLEPSMTVKEVKEKAHEPSGIEPDQMKLIFKGRILKDADTLESHKVEGGNTMHVVKSAPSPTPATTPAATPAADTAGAATGAPAPEAGLHRFRGDDVLCLFPNW